MIYSEYLFQTPPSTFDMLKQEDEKRDKDNNHKPHLFSVDG